MTYEEAREFIAWTQTIGYRLGLDSTRELLNRLGNPQDDLKFVHIAGTNGKGSVLAFTSTILRKAGYRVGRYVSPTIYSYRERIQVNEEYISREHVAQLTSKIREACDSMVKDGLEHPTCFEVETAMAFLYFKMQKCDVVVLETGMGGLTDATNVIKTTLVSVLVSISMDHMQYLGDTLAKIAEMKAGIIKPNTIVVTAPQKEEAMRVIEQTCQERGCKLRKVDTTTLNNIQYGFDYQSFSYLIYDNLNITLAGSYQIENAAVAIETAIALKSIGFDITESSMRRGLLATEWPARFYAVRRDPLFIIDGAHNRGAADRLRESILQYFPKERKVFIIGAFADKEYEYVVSQTAPLADYVLTVETPNNPRALSANELAEVVRKYNPNVEACDSLQEAAGKAIGMMKTRRDVVIAFGSLSYLGEISEYVPQGRL